MVTINPADCPPDRVYMGIVNGRREVMCRFPHRELPWETFANVHADDSVSDLVPLVEARPITRDEQGEMWARIRDELRKHYGAVTDADHRLLDLAASASADAAVEYLNDRGGLGIDTREPLERALRERDSFRCDLDWARGKCDELRSLIEGQKANVTQAQRERDTARFERDAAFESYKRMKRERDEADRRTAEAEADRDRWKRHHDRVDGQWAKAEREVTRLTLALDRLERQRDAAVERAEAAERVLRERDEQEDDATRAACERAEQAERDRDEWKARAEHAEQLIPAYAMLDIWMALGRDSIHFDDWYDEHGYADAWAELTSAVREARTAPAVSRADIEKAVGRRLNGEVWNVTFPKVVDEMCDLFGIEAEQDVDPIEELAEELWPILHPQEAPWRESLSMAAEGTMHGAVLRKMMGMARAAARHVLGQEASSDE